ncbi:DUF1707 domain-containing protein [Actinophytocola sp.]|uniref:DUF1707 SHOCT-like domain-containing protein n=1 Tax=Actinophytocola sp. TaxID=1872138 RepID=UPI002ED38528
MNERQEIEAVRASDTERERIAKQISEATAEGRLSITEADERLERVYAATFRHELAEFVADLPQRQAPARPLERFPTRLRLHAAIAVVVSVLLIARWVAMDVPFFWPAGPMLLLWGSFLVHTRAVRFGGVR